MAQVAEPLKDGYNQKFAVTILNNYLVNLMVFQYFCQGVQNSGKTYAPYPQGSKIGPVETGYLILIIFIDVREIPIIISIFSFKRIVINRFQLY